MKLMDEYLKIVIHNSSRCANCIFNHNGICFFAYRCLASDFQFYKSDSPTGGVIWGERKEK